MIHDKKPKWFERFARHVDKCWIRHGWNETLCFKSGWCDEMKEWVITVCPVFQEIYGGEGDGKTTWTGFAFDIGMFLRSKNVNFPNFAVFSECVGCGTSPRAIMVGRYRNHPVRLEVLLQPAEDTQVMELVDVIHQKVMPKDLAEDQEDNQESKDNQEPKKE